ncbi:MAG: glycerophosphodiester phosphodiesterase family protein [Patescibacteria group bacterium]|nr:glycerophosphodiester phosphodiesterase family protein [Patescibacteria group bacterium]
MLKQNFTLLIIIILILISGFYYLTICLNKTTKCNYSKIKNNINLDKYIAHAGGEYKKLYYTNSLEALNYNYEKGYRIFEVDISLTSDNKIVLIHDWKNTSKKYFSQNKIPSHKEFMSWKMNYGLTQIDLNTLIEWIKNKNNARIITDVKTKNNIKILKKISIKYPGIISRIIPQIYNFQEYDQISKMGYKNIILTLYRINNSDKEILNFAKEKNILAITMPINRAKTELPKKILQLGIPTFAHTVNSKKKEKKLKNNYCVFGIYTDSLNSF